MKQKRQYLFLEYCPYGTLTKLITKGLKEVEVLRLFRQLVEGMCYMNAKSTCPFTKIRYIVTSSQITS